MRPTIDCLTHVIKKIPRRGELAPISVLDGSILAPPCSSRAISRHRVRPLPLFQDGNSLQWAALCPLRFTTLLVPHFTNPISTYQRISLTPSSPSFQRRVFSFHQTGLKQVRFPDRAQDMWYLKIFALFVLSALLTRSHSVLASEGNRELSPDELKEIAEDLHIEEIDDSKALQQECFTRLMSLCLTRHDSSLLKALDAKKIAKLKDLTGKSLLIASIEEGASTEVIRYLIEAERISQARSRDAEGNTPLHIAAKQGRSDLVKDLFPYYLNHKNNKEG